MFSLFKKKVKPDGRYHLISISGGDKLKFIKARIVFTGNKYIVFRSESGKEYSRRLATVKIKPLEN